MTITIHIKDPDTIDNIKAVGARDLLEHFLPLAHIHADSIRVHERTPEETKKMLRGVEYSYYEDTHTAPQEYSPLTSHA
jgi:hypothetical protein